MDYDRVGELAAELGRADRALGADRLGERADPQLLQAPAELDDARRRSPPAGPAPRTRPPAGRRRPSGGGRDRRRRRGGRGGTRSPGCSGRRRRGGRCRPAARTPAAPGGRAGPWRRRRSGCSAGATSRASRSRTAAASTSTSPARAIAPAAMPGASRRTSRCSSANASASHGSVRASSTVSTAADAQSLTSASRSTPAAAIARRPDRVRPLSTSRAVGAALSRSSRRTPPRITRCCRSAFVSTRSDTRRSVVEQRRVAGRGDARLLGRHLLRQRADVPRHHPPPLVDRRHRGDRLARRRGQSALDRREVVVGVDAPRRRVR